MAKSSRSRRRRVQLPLNVCAEEATGVAAVDFITAGSWSRWLALRNLNVLRVRRLTDDGPRAGISLGQIVLRFPANLELAGALCSYTFWMHVSGDTIPISYDIHM